MPLTIAIVVLVLIVGLMIWIASRPGAFRIERSTLVNVPAGVVFPLINDFHQWARWSPWEKFDPNMKKTFEGPAAGPGSMYAWTGNKKVGEGRMTVLENKPDELVLIKLEFLKPFKATNRATFRLVPSGNSTHVSWAMEGNKNFVMKGFSLFMNMDELVGKDFEQGLINLNSEAQKDAGQAR